MCPHINMKPNHVANHSTPTCTMHSLANMAAGSFEYTTQSYTHSPAGASRLVTTPNSSWPSLNSPDSHPLRVTRPLPEPNLALNLKHLLKHSAHPLYHLPPANTTQATHKYLLGTKHPGYKTESSTLFPGRRLTALTCILMSL
jgi:hypothetical protein